MKSERNEYIIDDSRSIKCSSHPDKSSPRNVALSILRNQLKGGTAPSYAYVKTFSMKPFMYPSEQLETSLDRTKSSFCYITWTFYADKPITTKYLGHMFVPVKFIQLGVMRSRLQGVPEIGFPWKHLCLILKEPY